MLFEQTKKAFAKAYGNCIKTRTYFAPGRVNLIGEHIDYYGGLVFPCAIGLGTCALVRKRKDDKIRMYSKNFSTLGIFESSINIEDLEYSKKKRWTNYPEGVIKILKEHGYNISTGFDIAYLGSIPTGSGLSSSASIEVLTAYILNDLFNLGITKRDMALFSQEAEVNHIGVKCGIMDQFVIANGKKSHALLLNTDTLEYDEVPFELGEYRLVVINTNKRRRLEDSKYNERRAECEEGLKILKQHFDIENLCQLDNLDCLIYLKENPIIYRRVRHVITENMRVKESAERLKKGEMDEFGRLMYASHCSLKMDYDVTGEHLDTIVETASQSRGVIGARMTGAGFGGSAIAIVEDKFVSEFISNMRDVYFDNLEIEPTFYIVNVEEGPRELES